MSLIYWPRPVNAAIIGASIALVAFTYIPGWVPSAAPSTVTVIDRHAVVSTRIVERKVRGRIIYRENRVYVYVPMVVVHTDHHTIRVPAHTLPLRSAAATVADPLVTVHVAVPTTIYPDPVTVTTTVTSTEIIPTTVTSTITLPLGGDGPGT